METLLLFVIFILTLLVLFYKHVTRNYGYLESLGIPVEAPFLCFGSGPFAVHKVFWHENPSSLFKVGTTEYGHSSYFGTNAPYKLHHISLKMILSYL